MLKKNRDVFKCILLFSQEKVKSCSSRLKDLQATGSSSDEAVKLATKVRK